ncbi:TetR family transcriptional regulator [Roseibium sp. TrichSKD4]|uniref:hypothetical protein n=1 Tax=Roseibium sp. TrichSKD4 TaxID=744980 RepID=UPI0001E561F1|nr:hypothetical protein [Roseibium sp. TrichSKD4]EFO34446.1 TetR family transcriptional regulator [Roseibium sp. TrichSKD4]
MIDSYLSSRHLGDLDGQCPMIALPSDVARATPEVRSSYETLLKAMTWLFENNLPDAAAAANRQKALALSAMCVGGMVLSRTIDNPELSAEIREAARMTALTFSDLLEVEEA